MNGLKITYELEKLTELLEERTRLVDVLKIQPSKNDNAKLKKHINHTLDLLMAYEKDVPTSEESNFEHLINRYNGIVQSLPATLLDPKLYVFERQPSVKEDKRVRFKDDLEDEGGPSGEAVETFKPYRDDIATGDVSMSKEDSTLTVERRELFGSSDTESPKYSVTPQLSNQDIYIQQQQQLMEQDSHLENLSSSINRTHGVSVNINEEVEYQSQHFLSDLERQVDRSGSNLSRAGRRLSTYEATARENRTCFTIAVLTIILFILLII